MRTLSLMIAAMVAYQELEVLPVSERILYKVLFAHRKSKKPKMESSLCFCLKEKSRKKKTKSQKEKKTLTDGSSTLSMSFSYQKFVCKLFGQNSNQETATRFLLAMSGEAISFPCTQNYFLLV